MLSSYLRQQVTLKPAQRDSNGGALTDDRGGILYDASRVIPCRRCRKEQVILTTEGRMIKIGWIYYCADQIFPEDMLDGRLVQDVVEWAGLGGQPMGYKAVV